ncbi:hypothetical protein [Puia dinghuensis]|uniref:Uncharacterized protein n=1 Tax=Puia dinghuensis TaxID=1792502 RepID=A0A8J2U6A9_9BACT|nr:hypothetical protein [Puia dinghuensis]GGA81836.1 hypothetical protein GCM10011511_01000 [Puia dinghuensis]
MKNIINSVCVFIGSALLFSACTKQKYELGALASKSALFFTIAPSSANPNNIVLTSLTPNLTPVWVTPFGQSQRVKDTVNIPFPGTYKFVYGVESAGGFVQADTTTVTINTLDATAVSSTPWVNLTGGYGKSKTWVLDITPTGTSKLFNGPIYFGGTGWEWDAGWASWICPVGDYGSMTFDLIGNANFSSNNKMLPLGQANGHFMLYTNTNQLATIGAELIHDPTQGPNIANWYAKMSIKSLTADGLQIIALKDANDWCIYNYVSQDYYTTH